MGPFRAPRKAHDCAGGGRLWEESPAETGLSGQALRNARGPCQERHAAGNRHCGLHPQGFGGGRGFGGGYVPQQPSHPTAGGPQRHGGSSVMAGGGGAQVQQRSRSGRGTGMATKKLVGGSGAQRRGQPWRGSSASRDGSPGELSVKKEDTVVDRSEGELSLSEEDEP